MSLQEGFECIICVDSAYSKKVGGTECICLTNVFFRLFEVETDFFSLNQFGIKGSL